MVSDEIIFGDAVVDFQVLHPYHKSSKLAEYHIGIDAGGYIKYYRFNQKQFIKLFNKKVLLCKVKKIKHEWIEVLDKPEYERNRKNRLKNCKYMESA